MEEDFFTKSQSWKKVRQTRNQDAARTQKRATVPLIGLLSFMWSTNLVAPQDQQNRFFIVFAMADIKSYALSLSITNSKISKNEKL